MCPSYYHIMSPPLSLLIQCLLLLLRRLLDLMFLMIKIGYCIMLSILQLNLPTQFVCLLVRRLNLCSPRAQVSTRLTPSLWPSHLQNNIQPAFLSLPMQRQPCPSLLHAHAQILHMRLLIIHWPNLHHCLCICKQNLPPG